MRQLSAYEKQWPVAGAFTISRSSLTVIPTVWVETTENGVTGRAECRPYGRYGDTVESVLKEIETLRPHIENGINRTELNDLLKPGPARNALDCALWDLEAKQTQNTVASLLGVQAPRPRVTAYTLSLQSPEDMAKAALKASDFPLLKIKVNKENAITCSLAVINSRPDVKLIIDANESLEIDSLDAFIKAIPNDAISMIEQPLHADTPLTKPLPTHIVICADESLHGGADITRDDLTLLWEQGYRAINIKLDKSGGLTAAHKLTLMARAMGFKIMLGCMVGSSLAMSPILMLESFADVLDIDGPLLLKSDCTPTLNYQGPMVHPPSGGLWGIG